MQEKIITIQYEMWEENIIPRPPYPMPTVGIIERLRLTFVDGQYEAQSVEPDASPNWIGRAENRHEAILNYLKTRLGIYEK